MTIRPLFLVLLTPLVLLAGCSDDGARLPLLAPDAVILAFGDSLTRGSGAKAHESYPAVLSGLIGREVVNAGVPGELSATGLERLPRWLDKTSPSLLILCHGANDMLRKKNLDTARDNIAQMIALARERGVPVVLLGVPAPGIFLSTAEFHLEVAEQTSTPILADVFATILSDAGLKSDAVHPNAAGYRQLAEAIAAWLVELGALGET